jgi:hypothetical protein
MMQQDAEGVLNYQAGVTLFVLAYFARPWPAR